MTNKELQDKLRKFPDDMEVKIEVDRYCYEQSTPPYLVQLKVFIARHGTGTRGSRLVRSLSLLENLGNYK
jgi:hypothetical protein